MTYNRICLMIPTYKRFNTSLPVLVQSAMSHVAKPESICMSFCVNTKDDGTQMYLKNTDFDCDWEIILENTTTPNLAKYYNMIYNQTKFNDPTTCVSMIGDDFQFMTEGWERHLLDLINNYHGVGVFWANDNFIARERMCVNMFTTRKFVEATEEPFMCELYPADMIDYLWMKVGKYSKSLHFLPNVIIQHNHETKKPEAMRDETFKRLVPLRKSAHDNYGKPHAKELAEKIAKRLIAKGMRGDNQ